MYQSIGEVFCPYLGRPVLFTRRGWEHLPFKGKRRARSITEQRVRLRLLSLSVQALAKSHTVHGIERCSVRSDLQAKSRMVIYHEFIAVIEGFRIKIIISQIGRPILWSIIPAWRAHDRRDAVGPVAEYPFRLFFPKCGCDLVKNPRGSDATTAFFHHRLARTLGKTARKSIRQQAPVSATYKRKNEKPPR